MASVPIVPEKWANVEECRAHYEAHHPAVKKAIAEGGCDLVNSPFGVLVFGDKSQPVIISERFRREYSTTPIARDGWPAVLRFGDVQLEFLGKQSGTGNMLYKITEGKPHFPENVFV